VQWCSQFPGEAEVLFAPLTELEVVGEPKVVDNSSTIVVSMRLSCNLHDLTIEQVTAKMYNSHNFPPESLKQVEDHRRRMRGHGGQWFNSSDNFPLATNQALKDEVGGVPDRAG
jgi:hypothetical protein